MPHAAMRRRRRETGDIEQGAAAHREDVGVAVDVKFFHAGMDFRDVVRGIFGALAPLDEQRGANKPDGIGLGGEIIFDGLHQPRLRGGERVIQDDEDFACGTGRAIFQNVLEQRIDRRENILGEMHPQWKIDPNGSLDDRHALQCGR